MIYLDNVYKSYKGQGGHRTEILNGFSGLFQPGVNVGILGRNGAGKSTLMRLLSGAEPPDRGQIHRKGRISWPLGFAGGFHGSLTGRANLRLISDIYGVDYQEVVEFVEDFSGLGRFMEEQVRTYSSGMRARLAFGASMAIRFDYYLIDEVIAVGDTAFKEQCQKVLTERRKEATVILVSHSSKLLKEFCDIGGVLSDGSLTFYDSIDEAIAIHEGKMRLTITK
jgi:capsular polysaccharide transport system ATP-binding protein